MNLRLVVCVLLLGSTANTMAQPQTLSCPNLSTAIQVGSCPSEEELKYTFNGYCSDNARMYEKGTDACTDYQEYRRMKNTAPWEAGNGVFQAYLSCDLPATSLKNVAPASIAVARQGKITRVVCTYQDEIVFTYRTRAECKVEGDGNCSTEGAACKANCN